MYDDQDWESVWEECDICGEPVSNENQRAEMYDPEKPGLHIFCHDQCGIERGLEVA